MKLPTMSMSAVLLAALILLGACTTGNETNRPQTIAKPEELISAAELQADFDTLWSTLRSAHYDIDARRSKAEYEERYAQVRASLTAPMTRLQAQLAFQRFVAYGRVAHARIDLPFEHWASFREAGGKACPLWVRVDGERVFVLQDLSGAPEITPGDEILAVGGEPVLDWLQRMGSLVSADTDYLLYAQMQGMLPALIWFVMGEVDGLELTLAGTQGGNRSAWLPARSRTEVAATEAAEASDEARIDMQSREMRLLDDGVAYLRPGPCYDHRPEASSPWDLGAFRAFIDQSFHDLIAAGTGDLLIDLRDNPGGDNSFSDLLIAWFAKEPFRFSEAFEIRVSAATIASNQARLDAAPADIGGASAEMAALFAGKAPGSMVRYPTPA